MDCFNACNYQIGDRAYYRLKPEDQLISLDTNARLDKPGVLHTVLHQRGVLPADSCDDSNCNQQKQSVTCSGTEVSDTMADTM